jgi:histidyl-tRNA synthetase
MFKRIPGTKDILPGEIEFWQKIAQTSRTIFKVHNYHEICPPLIEEAALFNRSLGEATEIIRKQMFIIKKEQDTYALRPEGTASVVRAYIENNLDKDPGFVKLYYMGSMFRCERPQKGRQREFHHIGCEAIGSYGPEIDIEIIALADNLLTAYPIKGYRLIINSLGCAKDKNELNSLLKERLKDKTGELCEDCKVRYGQNILRVLDCKNESCREIVEQLDIADSYLCPECKGHFNKVKKGLDILKIKYEVSPNLVRGLDYYTRTVFEIKHPDLGPQQDALGAGGRYDNLVKELGGPETGAIGFAFGVERLLLAQGQIQLDKLEDLVYIITLGDPARDKGLELLQGLRKAGIPSDTDYENRSLKGAMRKANDLGAKFVLIIGEDELKEASVTLKDMAKSTQEKISQAKLIDRIKSSP